MRAYVHLSVYVYLWYVCVCVCWFIADRDIHIGILATDRSAQIRHFLRTNFPPRPLTSSVSGILSSQ